MNKCIVGLKDGRVVYVQTTNVSDFARIKAIQGGCDSVITMDIEDAPEWKSQVKIKLEVGDDG